MRGEIGMEDNIRTEVINAIIEGKSDYAGELIEAHKPEYLYKYRSDSEYALDALRKKSVLISRATEMDDDADGRLYVSEDFKKMFEIAKKLNPKFQDPKYSRAVYGIEEESKQTTFISSFSELNNNEDMWKRYANEKKGFCIEYKFEDLFLSNGYGLTCFPVSYEDKKPLGAREIKSKENMVFTTLYKKNRYGVDGEDWIGQREWRWSCFEKTLGLTEGQKRMLIPVAKPTRIFIGENASEDFINQLENVIEDIGENVELIRLQK